MIKDKHPLKSETDTQRMLNNIQRGQIEDWMWIKIIEKMYEENDAQNLHDQIRNIIGNK